MVVIVVIAVISVVIIVMVIGKISVACQDRVTKSEIR